MTLVELFHAVNLAGIRLANVNGGLQLRGATVPTDVKAGAIEHKESLLALLPAPVPPVEQTTLTSFVRSPSAENGAAVQPGEDLLGIWRQLQSGTASSFGAFCRRKEHRCGWRFGTGPADVRCADCYPPARPELVQQWEWSPDAEGVAALLRLAKSSE